MVKLKILSEVNVKGMKIKDEYIQEFDDKENVFGRVLIYHQRMNKVFPNCEYKLLKTKQITC